MVAKMIVTIADQDLKCLHDAITPSRSACLDGVSFSIRVNDFQIGVITRLTGSGDKGISEKKYMLASLV